MDDDDLCTDPSSPNSATLPVFIFLPSFVGLLQSPATRASLMSAVFDKLCGDNGLGGSSQTEQPQLQQRRFLFIFDGLDELGFHFILFDECGLQAWASHSVFVIMSRLGFLSEVGQQCSWRAEPSRAEPSRAEPSVWRRWRWR